MPVSQSPSAAPHSPAAVANAGAAIPIPVRFHCNSAGRLGLVSGGAEGRFIRRGPADVRYSLWNGSRAMKTADFRRIALSLEGAEEVTHAGLPAFRVGGRRFASLAHQADGYGNLTLTPEHQAAFVKE